MSTTLTRADVERLKIDTTASDAKSFVPEPKFHKVSSPPGIPPFLMQLVPVNLKLEEIPDTHEAQVMAIYRVRALTLGLLHLSGKL